MKDHTVVVITTGGTIAMRDEGAGAVPTLEGEGLLGQSASSVPDLNVQIAALANLPSPHLTLEMLWHLRGCVLRHLEEPSVRGVVVTHGTDTLTETAYLLDLTIPSPKPLVVTGAMRASSEPGYDGRANIRQSLRVVADRAARERGTMVVFNDEVHAARYVTKTMSHNPATFQSPDWGPMARFFGERLVWGWSLARQGEAVEGLETDVHLLRVAAGADPLLLRLLVERRVAGIVIEGVGAGRVPPNWLPLIRQATAQGTAVEVARGTTGGHTGDSYGYEGAARTLEAAGARFAEGVDGRKARLRLMVALGRRMG